MMNFAGIDSATAVADLSGDDEAVQEEEACAFDPAPSYAIRARKLHKTYEAMDKDKSKVFH